MTEKRIHPRKECNIKTKFDYFEGDPETVSVNQKPAKRSKGYMLNVSISGAFLVCNCRVSVQMPIKLYCKIQKTKLELEGEIVRTGMVQNNPSEVAQRYAAKNVKVDSYIAIRFKELLPQSIIEQV
ncbi:MAG TPA: PilZ domain-containing protein [Spirochaetota bacterium]|nr:PilZ domain-containing protein [Spirochaetota bacterium]